MRLLLYPLALTAVALPLAAQSQTVSPTINELPSREFGNAFFSNTTLTSLVPNRVEGRELFSPQTVAFDTSVTPPIMYVADTFNNRVLAWKNPASLTKGNQADKVIGQRDMTSTRPQGPGTSLATGTTYPVAVAVDSKGNLYVADAGNNRILRYPAPFNQTSALLQVDLVIGQKSQTTGVLSNEGNNNNTPSEKTISLCCAAGGSPAQTGLAFDKSGNLWFADAFNNRVLRYPVANLAAFTIEPAADIVLGYSIFTTNALPDGQNQKQQNKSNLFGPAGLAFDVDGNLYVSDSFARVLYFTAPLNTGTPAQRVLGINPTDSTGKPINTYPNSSTLGFISNGTIQNPFGIAVLGSNLFVCDTPQNRIVMYDIPARWSAQTDNAYSPVILAVTGQADLVSGKPNRTLPDAQTNSLNAPSGVAFLGTDLWVVDSGNNRVISFPQNGGPRYTDANRVVGQLDFPYRGINLLDGRELFFSANLPFISSAQGAGIAFDNRSNPPHMYVADTNNHRVLGFRDARNITQNTKADIVIGQVDFNRSVQNYPNNDPALMTDSSLNFPLGVAVAANGDLFVADAGNSRVLRFPSPFTQSASAGQHANLVLGQLSFNSADPSISQQNMAAPYGVAIFSDGSIAVSDPADQRVLIYRKPAGGDFPPTGAFADLVLGQSGFLTKNAGTGTSQLSGPQHMAVDTSDRLYVTDTRNGRISVFTNIRTASNGQAAAFTIPNLNSPQSVAVSQLTGEIWVADSGNARVLRLQEFSQLQLNPGNPTAVISVSSPYTIALDSADNLVVAEFTNRLSFFFAKMSYQHAASYNANGVAPGMLMLLSRLGKDFSFTENVNIPLPWPSDVNDIRITCYNSDVAPNGLPVPIFHLVDRPGFHRADIQAPMALPTSGTVDFVLSRISTGEILGAATFPLVPSNPGFFAINGNGTGQAAATFQDATGANFINGPAPQFTPIKAGSPITFYLTGQGKVDGAPPDGVSPSGVLRTPILPRIVINGEIIADKDILYSGLGAFPGGWQINVNVPSDIGGPGGTNAVNPGVVVALTYNDVASNVGANGNRITVTITTRQ